MNIWFLLLFGYILPMCLSLAVAWGIYKWTSSPREGAQTITRVIFLSVIPVTNIAFVVGYLIFWAFDFISETLENKIINK